jgi:hypothetical protein
MRASVGIRTQREQGHDWQKAGRTLRHISVVIEKPKREQGHDWQIEGRDTLA